MASNNRDDFTYQPAAGRRRVSMVIAVPVIAGCAALGSFAGVTHPLHSLFPSDTRALAVLPEQRPEMVPPSMPAPPAVAHAASTDVPAKGALAEEPSANEVRATQARAQPPPAEPTVAAIPAAVTVPQSTTPAPGHLLSTGSVVSDERDAATKAAAASTPGRSEQARAETDQGQRVSRARKHRRAYARRLRVKSAQQDFFSSLLTITTK